MIANANLLNPAGNAENTGMYDPAPPHLPDPVVTDIDSETGDEDEAGNDNDDIISIPGLVTEPHVETLSLADDEAVADNEQPATLPMENDGLELEETQYGGEADAEDSLSKSEE